MSVDTGIYSNLLAPPKSVADYNTIAAQQQLMRNQLANLPLQNQLLQSQVDQSSLANQQARQRFNMLAPLLARLAGGGAPNAQGGDVSAPGNALAAGGGAQMGGGATGGQGGGVPFPLSFNDVVALKAMGGPDLSADFKIGLEGVSRAPGAEVTDVRGIRRMVPKIGEGQQIGPDGSISNIPGYVAANAQTKGAETGATEGAKAGYSLLPLGYLDKGGNPVGGTVANYLGAQGQPPATGMSPALAALPPSAQPKVLADMRRDGVQSATVNAATRGGPISGQINQQGRPDLSAVQQQLDAAKQGGPVALARFQAQYLPHVLQQYANDPQKLSQAVAQFQADLQTPPGTPLHAPPAQGAPAQPAAGGLQGPAEAAAQKAQAEADVKLRTQPGIDYNTDTAKSAAAYKTALDDAVTNGQALMLRVAESKDALTKFKPGMGADARLQVARAAQALGMPDAIVNKINDGDVAAKQEFVKLSAQTAMESLKQSMGSAGRITQAEFKVFQQNNPNIELDPNAIQKIYDFTTRVYQNSYKEQQSRAQYIQGGGNPAEWPAMWAKQMDPNGSGQISGGKNAPAASGGWKYIGPAK